MEKCKNRKCRNDLRNVSVLAMGPTWHCDKCKTNYNEYLEKYPIYIN